MMYFFEAVHHDAGGAGEESGRGTRERGREREMGDVPHSIC